MNLCEDEGCPHYGTLHECRCAPVSAPAVDAAAPTGSLQKLFKEALAWGMAYGPALVPKQWHTLSDEQASRFATRAAVAQDAAGEPVGAQQDPHVMVDFVNEVSLVMSELPDRNSPEDEPDSMICNDDELQSFIYTACEKLGVVIVRASESLSDECIREIEYKQAGIPGATRDNLTVRTVRACIATAPAIPVADALIEFPYQRTFDAIAAAVECRSNSALEISVEKFKKAFNGVPTAQRTDAGLADEFRTLLDKWESGAAAETLIRRVESIGIAAGIRGCASDLRRLLAADPAKGTNERDVGLTKAQIREIAAAMCKNQAMEFTGDAKVASYSDVIWAIHQALKKLGIEVK